ncbi:disco-interacting protein 2 homolog C-like [Erythrolamprus reginae]|uniref:disco-interacting protein 2 homolog C-like n=1 Tax=Erythrolamprus reginae TaxID=121349 RepID=UPI00396C32D0
MSYYQIAVFSVSVLHDERIVIVAEQRPDSTEEDSFQWMSRVLQFLFLSEVLQWRAQTTPDHVLYTLLNSSLSWHKSCPRWLQPPEILGTMKRME